jgi:multisubunit Na+/H+ antiporter MnhB subunit
MFTSLGNFLFVSGLVLLFVVLYHEPMRRGPLLWIVGALLIGTIACWITAAAAEKSDSKSTSNNLESG